MTDRGGKLALLLLLLSRPAFAQRVQVELALRHTSNVDETLSPLRYGGAVFAARAAAALPRARFTLLADADFAAGTLTTDAGTGGRPELRTVGGTGHLGAELRGRVVRGFTLAPGMRLAGRAAGREHQFTSAQSGGRFPGLVQPSFDMTCALQPTIVASRATGGGATTSAALAASLVGAARHPYFPRGLGGEARWTVGAPDRVLLAEGELRWLRPVTRRGALGARYSLQLLRIGGASRVAEATHQLGAVIAWGAP